MTETGIQFFPLLNWEQRLKAFLILGRYHSHGQRLPAPLLGGYHSALGLLAAHGLALM